MNKIKGRINQERVCVSKKWRKVKDGDSGHFEKSKENKYEEARAIWKHSNSLAM